MVAAGTFQNKLQTLFMSMKRKEFAYSPTDHENSTDRLLSSRIYDLDTSTLASPSASHLTPLLDPSLEATPHSPSSHSPHAAPSSPFRSPEYACVRSSNDHAPSPLAQWLVNERSNEGVQISRLPASPPAAASLKSFGSAHKRLKSSEPESQESGPASAQSQIVRPILKSSSPVCVQTNQTNL